MKKQNLIIIGVFLLVVVIFNLICCNSKNTVYEEVLSVNTNNYVYVNVGGEVKRSGEFKVPNNWSVKDLLSYVEVKDSADISFLNLEETLIDGKTYFIPKLGSLNVSYQNKININTATLSELMEIKGIGKTIANNIISYRNVNHFFKTEDIKNVSGIGDALYEKIKEICEENNLIYLDNNRPRDIIIMFKINII